MQFIAFVLVLWVSIVLTQVLALTPLDLLHLISLPRGSGLILLLGLFAWFFGE